MTEHEGDGTAVRAPETDTVSGGHVVGWGHGTFVQTWHVDICPEECEELLASSVLGRLGVVVNGRPEIFPINHVLDPVTRCVSFPTNARTKLQAALDWPWVAYEVDGMTIGEGGWSVLVVGRAEEITDPRDIARCAELRHVLWSPGRAARWLRIVPTSVTGRRISAIVR